MPLHDLRCEAGHVRRDHFVKSADMPADDDFGPCDEAGCEAHLHQYWGETHTLRKADNYTPVTLDGQHFATRDDWNAHLAKVQRAHPGKEIVLESATRAQWRADGETNRHEALTRIGVGSDRELKQYIREVKDVQRHRQHPPRR